VLYGSGVLDTIYGHMHDDGRWTDMYGIYLRPDKAFNIVPSVVPVGQNDDFGTLDIFLFDSQGRGIIGAKGTNGIYNFSPVAAGVHFLAIIPSSGDPYALVDPEHHGHARIFTNQAGNTVFPGGPGGGLPVDAWGGSFGATPNAYRIDFAGGVEFVPSPVPLPAAAWLLLSGLAGLGVLGRRRKH